MLRSATMSTPIMNTLTAKLSEQHQLEAMNIRSCIDEHAATLLLESTRSTVQTLIWNVNNPYDWYGLQSLALGLPLVDHTTIHRITKLLAPSRPPNLEAVVVHFLSVRRDHNYDLYRSDTGRRACLELERALIKYCRQGLSCMMQSRSDDRPCLCFWMLAKVVSTLGRHGKLTVSCDSSITSGHDKSVTVPWTASGSRLAQMSTPSSSGTQMDEYVMKG
ncbi:hypothetical protein BD309DRAFT_451150 [Dichomitus squalens]|nr:hypothetical protein BD309DRAFT_451150 [Dichomitus squalens]